ncbi:MAG TPA: hypothetical protein DEE98_05185 [Elusimicrobia bacterium]|nr:MAG: hypothetical protein A2278_04860 [Elusimicrobia bacterium RIFOXYA12_FULL_49_49]OGS14623.1 MAG: hypothetical protein A2251_08980 [Elusimicrobia bacterium RIFOXYA2_FULL_47_53]OGS25724.1 MAG: hypothetical protein A2339_06610 [Elusimicrobia bacterium RIFOXYB12_FULL_50_12]OGS31714.1 MAG: hypothetical protein A2323_05890 [Elusimicrobia bacterium RIFOXYB2_FULL_46_23]HBU69759.1 hypothetical protein [Elusimicrobiota bacterium]
MLKKLVAAWLPVAAWCGLIFYFSSIPDLKTSLGLWDLILRKAAHAFEYFVLFALSFRAFKAGAVSGRKLFFFAFVFTVLYACSDEFHQSFVADRVGSVKDVGIDSFGALLGLITIRKIYDKSK